MYLLYENTVIPQYTGVGGSSCYIRDKTYSWNFHVQLPFSCIRMWNVTYLLFEEKNQPN